MSFTRELAPSNFSPRAYPFAFPLAIGSLLTLWGIASLVRNLTVAYWTLPDLLWVIALLTVGIILLIVGWVGAVFVGYRGWTVG